jgi:enoyl-CoA hydratase/carnithine racemase
MRLSYLAARGAITVLTLNNPARLNAVNLAMRHALFDALIALGADETCRAIVLTGAEGNFSAGGDISEMRPRAIIEGRMRVELSTRIFRALVTSPKPVISAIEGKAFGCGVSFAAASDYAVAASDAKFSCAFVKVGLMADFGRSGRWRGGSVHAKRWSSAHSPSPSMPARRTSCSSSMKSRHRVRPWQRRSRRQRNSPPIRRSR